VSDSMVEKSRIMFFSNSRHCYPGTGASEELSERDRDSEHFDYLFQEKDFRRKLSNFYALEEGFLCDGRRWRTVEHCFQGRKFELDAPEYASLFSLDSGSSLSQEDGKAARRAGGKKGHPLSEEQLRRWDGRKRQVMKEALLAKFRQDEALRAILLATGDAELVHRPPRSRLMVEYNLMEVRDVLRTENN